MKDTAKSGKKELWAEGIVLTVERKKVKNLYLRVLPPEGGVRVTAPLFAGDRDVLKFVSSRLCWIREKQRQCRERTLLWEREKALEEDRRELWGVRYPLEIRETGKGGSVRLENGVVILEAPRGSTPEQREKLWNEWYREQLKRAIPPVLEQCEKTVGEQASQWRVKNMKTRWGTCNIPERRIWLNLQLAKKPPECLSYVITHELTYLKERNHNETFRRYMDEFFPEWREVKKRMNRKGIH